MAGATNSEEVGEARRKIPSAKVRKLVLSATGFLRTGQAERALQIADEAMAVQNATDMKQVDELVKKIAAKQPELLFREASEAIERQSFPKAARRLKGYVANPHVEKRKEAAELLTSLEIILDDSKAQAYLAYLRATSPEFYKGLVEQEALPNDLMAGGETLQDAVRLAARQTPFAGTGASRIQTKGKREGRSSGTRQGAGGAFKCQTAGRR